MIVETSEVNFIKLPFNMDECIVHARYSRQLKKQRTFLYDRRFSQLDISFMHVPRYLTAHIVADQFADGGGEIKIDGVDIFGYETVL